MVFISMVFSFDNLVIFGGKPVNWVITESCRENHDNFLRTGILAMIYFLNESLNNKL